MGKQIMARITRVPGSCPYCGSTSFIVHHLQANLYLINLGKIVDHEEVKDDAVGICNFCNKKLIFLPTPYGFYPMSKIGAIINDESYIPHDKDLDKKLDNPMKPTDK